jgi:hypothetical protein
MNAAAEDRLEVPEISTSTAGTVVVELTPDDAQNLARVLAHYDAIVTWRGPEGQRVAVADGYVPDTWHHTLIRLLAEAENARLQITAPTVLVPFRRPGATS